MHRKTEHHVKAEIRLMNLHTKGCQRLPANHQERGLKQSLPHSPQKETLPVLLSHPVCASLLWQPLEINMVFDLRIEWFYFVSKFFFTISSIFYCLFR